MAFAEIIFILSRQSPNRNTYFPYCLLNNSVIEIRKLLKEPVRPSVGGGKFHPKAVLGPYLKTISAREGNFCS